MISLPDAVGGYRRRDRPAAPKAAPKAGPLGRAPAARTRRGSTLLARRAGRGADGGIFGAGPTRAASVRRVLVALLVALALSGSPVAPAPTAAAQAVAAAPNLSVVRDEALPDFPDGVAFSLVATSPTPIERVELLYAAAGQETLNLVTPDHTPGTEIDVAHALDLRGALPPGVDLTYRWRLVDAAGDATETEPRTFLWGDDRFDWTPLAGARVTVYAYAGDPGFNRAILETAERTVDRLETSYGARQSEPIRMWVYDSGDDFGGALRPNTEPWIAGASYPALDLILAVLPADDAGEIGRLVPHEISHVLLHQATENPFNEPPTWLDEGLATVAQEVADPAYPSLVRAAAAEGRLEPVRTLNAQFPYDADTARLAYAQSQGLVEFIQDTYGPDGLARLIAVFRDGVSYDQAVRQALGVSLDQLDRAWRDSLDAAPYDPAAARAARDAAADDPGGLGVPEATLLASGGIVMGLAAILALVAGSVALARARRLPPDPFDADA